MKRKMVEKRYSGHIDKDGFIWPIDKFPHERYITEKTMRQLNAA